ncbi:DUF2971 domain-containing protein [Ruegeria sp. R13_0]|uniref:DUF2971 domain-containing protein n=1 Tax=Ruegeria sp. R13_0 TaxID=2821099 RepID=UPI001ADC139A|nr:DUF2971 domain-containing protein [Ruegeria sp. R13_0]MBO9436307.1 DUF2971 domain-containing protein [Ruegeria sp. R13_0]
MEVDEGTQKFLQIFQPGYLEKMSEVAETGQRFAYYTNADTALKILRNQELWFRNATVLNDFSEISYGIELMHSTLSGPSGQRFEESVEDIFKGTIELVNERLKGWVDDWQLETYIACISEHDDSEDRSGRLSMWRAYGDTALVINNTPLMAVTDLLGVYSTPVEYLSLDEYQTRLDRITDCFLINRRYLQSLGQPTIVEYIHHMLFLSAISTKHPGFSEEKEWRLFYRPNEQKSAAMVERIEVLGGVPQIVFSLPLKNEPEQGLFSADIPTLLDRVIIGPTEYPYVSERAFVRVLEEVGVSDVSNKVVPSDIPLRTG